MILLVVRERLATGNWCISRSFSQGKHVTYQYYSSHQFASLSVLCTQDIVFSSLSIFYFPSLFYLEKRLTKNTVASDRSNLRQLRFPYINNSCYLIWFVFIRTVSTIQSCNPLCLSYRITSRTKSRRRSHRPVGVETNRALHLYSWANRTPIILYQY